MQPKQVNFGVSVIGGEFEFRQWGKGYESACLELIEEIL
jgi:hypothetical protein